MSNYDTSQTLISKLQQEGNDAAWQRFASEYRAFIFALIRDFQVTEEDREELVQDVLLKVWKALPGFLYERERCRFRTWLARVTRNTALNFVNTAHSRNQKRAVDNGDEVIKLYSCDSLLDEREENEWRIFITRKAWTNVQQHFNERYITIYSEMLKGSSTTELAAELNVEEESVLRYRRKVQQAMNRELRSINSELDG